MPLEIKELHIKVTVNQPSQGQQSAAAAPSGGQADDDKDAIISQCVDEVLEIINNKKER